MTRIFAIATQKGGVGKSTLATNLSGVIARTHHIGRTLLVDLDPQANATSIFLGEEVAYGPDPGLHIYHGLCKATPASQIIKPAKLTHRGRDSAYTLDILPAHVHAAAAELELFAALNRERQLQNCLEGVLARYDTIILDCPPSLGLITINALTAATDVLIPVEPGRFSIVGLAQLLRTIDTLRSGSWPINPKLNLFGIVLMKADNTALTALTAKQLEENFADKVLPSVPARSSVRESQNKVTDLIGHIGLGREAESGALRAFIEIADRMVTSHGDK